MTTMESHEEYVMGETSKPLFSEYEINSEIVEIRKERNPLLVRKRLRSEDEEEEDQEETENDNSANEDEKEAPPAWMRYMPRRKIYRFKPSEPTDDHNLKPRKHSASSNPFSPMHPKNLSKLVPKATEPMHVEEASSQKKRQRLRYRSSNADEAAELVKFFNISKS